MNNKESTTESENNSQMKVFLPNKLLECLPRISTLPKERLRWNTNEEIASYLISFDRHEEWLSCTLKTRPLNGSIILYNRKKVKYRKDGYCWKKRKDGKTTREDHMKLKVQGMECLYGCYVHSSIVPTFHRRCYWLLQNPDIVLVHYLNVPSLEDCGKACGPLLCAVADRRDSLRWTREELLSQLKPMFHSIKWSCSNSNGSSEFSIEQLVQHVLDSQQTKPQPRTHACLCSTALASPGANIPHRCNSTKHRIISPKLPARPSPYPALTEVQNLATAEGAGNGSGQEGGRGELLGGGGGGAGMGGDRKGAPPLNQPQAPVVAKLGARSPAVSQDSVGLTGVSSPCSASSSSSSSSSSPPQPHRATPIALSNGGTACNGFYGNQRGLATVALPQNAVIVMTTAIGRGAEDSKGELGFSGTGTASPRLSLTHSGRLVLSPIPPNPETSSPPTVATRAALAASPAQTSVTATVPSSGAGSLPPSSAPAASHSISPTPGVATLSLTLLSSPVVGGLLLTDRLISGADPPAPLLLPPSSSPSSTSPSPSLLPPPATSAPSPSLLPPPPCPPSPSIPSPSAPPAFDPDSFLNSPKRGQTYGGPSHPDSHLSLPLATSCSSPSPPSSSSPQPPSLALSLSPTSPPSSSSPPSSLSSLSAEMERGRSGEREAPPLAARPASTPSSSPLSPSLSLSPSRSAAPLLPLSLESTLGLDALGVLTGDAQDQAPERGRGEGVLGPPLSPGPEGVPAGPPLLQCNPRPLPQTLCAPQPSQFQGRAEGKDQQQKQQQQVLLLRPKQLQQPGQPLVLVQPEQHTQMLQPQLLPAQSLQLKGGLLFVASGQDEAAAQPASPDPRVQVKEEQSSPFSPSSSSSSSSSSSGLGHYEAEETPMDTNSPGEGAQVHRAEDADISALIQKCGGRADGPEVGGGPLEISFDSQFPDLISEFIAEDEDHNVAGSAQAQAPPLTQTATLFPAGVRYMVPPQPSPASSFLPFPTLAPASPSTGTGVEVRRLATITDFSPEWSYPEGGVKVLITGPWTEATGRYSCVFDQSTVPASLIQPGVLRCYCPAHEAGLVALQVLEDMGTASAVSSSVLFEYRARNASSLPSSQLDWLSLDDNQFRMSILERLEQMEKRMAEMTAANSNHHQQQQQQQQQQSTQNTAQQPAPGMEDRTQSGPWFERRIVGVCERMMAGGQWGGGGERLLHSVRHRGMTLLHLAAAQGYTQLIHTLIHWRTVNSDSLDLEQEVDPLNVDHFSCTPLMWACALGHQGAAVLLYRWNSLALGIPDSLGRLPLAVARSRGHTRLARCLEELHTQGVAQERRGQVGGERSEWGHTHTPEDPPPPPPHLPPSPLSTSPDTGLSSSSSIPSPSDPPSPSPSSAYSSGSVPLGSPLYSPPDPMDTSDPSLSACSSPSSLPLSSPSPSLQLPLPLPPWGEACEARAPSLSAGRGEPTFLMEYEPTCTPSPPPGPPLSRHSAFEAELLSYSENAENEDYLPAVEDLQVDMATLAEQIIEATPERIKQEEFPREAESPLRERRDNTAIHDTMPWLATYLDTVDTLPTLSPPRCVCPTPPPSSRSPQPPSPLSALALQRLRPPSSAAWAEFLNASANGRMERDFALLTLTDSEQRELYEAARIIQNAFRRYKGRRLKEQQDMAAAVIQRCYRKYKQLTWIALKYALYKKMTQAAILIQSKFRSYYEQKKFQQSRRAAVLIQQYYRSYKEYERLKQGHRGPTALNTKIKGSFLTKKQDQAARKIMRFLRRCRHRIKELKQSKELEMMQKRGLTT
ncbi:calmodulin-binding transcription activator 2 isoform X2 [Megalops cyprinoides]|uniref:calmodulin-binding transcription activator 2 isoform X2 n=1 Tax=Megalops cyprinoides TaxID=118141 RepID=UPI0018647154|nr:calmodulin-binding transcription activator 2 isoform X2 [Megalops cyprinoides]